MLKLGLVLLLCVFSFSAFPDVPPTKPYTVYLREGTLLKRLKDNQTLELSKGIYAKVLELNPKRRDRFYVYDNSGVAVYETSAMGISEIEDDIRLLPNVNAEKIYPPKSVLKTTDKIAMFDSQFSLHFDNLGVAPLNDIYSDQISSVISTRYEIRTLYVSVLPFEFGFTFNYQSAYWKNDFEDVKLSILSVGPQFKYNLFKNDSFNAHVLFGAEIPLLYEGTTANFKDKYSAQMYDLGVESEWLSPMGIITFGSHFRHHQVALSDSDRINLELTPKEFTLNSLGVMLGYKIEWEL